MNVIHARPAGPCHPAQGQQYICLSDEPLWLQPAPQEVAPGVKAELMWGGIRRGSEK